MFNDFYNRSYEFFAAYDWSHFIFWARIISGIFSLALMTAIVIIVKRLYQYHKPLAHTIIPASKMMPEKTAKGPWQDIVKKLESDNPSDWNLAVIQADAVVDSILKEMGLTGETMGERLKTLDRSRLASLDDLWEAHRIRNQIAHETDRTVTKHQANYAISLFEKVLKELEYLE